MKVVWDVAAQIPGFLNFMPRDWHAKNHRVERRYVYVIMATLNEGFTFNWILDIKNQKEQRKLLKQKVPTRLQVHPDMALLLLEHDFVPGK